MHLRRFGRLSWKVSEIGYGMWGMGGWIGSDDAESGKSPCCGGTPARHQGGAFYQTAVDAEEKPRILSLGRLIAEAGLSRIDLLKLHCEGAEWDILRGAEAVLPQVAQICVEYHREGGWTPEKLTEWLTGVRYNVRIQSGGGWNGLLWARRGGLL